MAYTRLFNIKPLEVTRRHLRQHGTRAEAVLWLRLKRRQLRGRRFRRQYSVGPYVLDFYCPAERLAVELDGRGHAQAAQQQHDAARARHLTTVGIRVVRFANARVLAEPDAVLAEIAARFGTDPSAP